MNASTSIKYYNPQLLGLNIWLCSLCLKLQAYSTRSRTSGSVMGCQHHKASLAIASPQLSTPAQLYNILCCTCALQNA